MAIEIVRLPLKMLLFDRDINLAEGIPQMAMGNIEKHMKRQKNDHFPSGNHGFSRIYVKRLPQGSSCFFTSTRGGMVRI
jgi:hypothetical protein